MRMIIAFALAFSFVPSVAQQSRTDSSRLLQEVVIEAYETERRLNEVPASVTLITSEHLEKFNNTSILPAVNLIPGVKMEERSPGSYRFSIRGSSLRSPFGVRNVKVYWNGLPFTDGGGNTYLNLFDFGSVSAVEVIKGPGGSLYGAGTGGVILLKSPKIEKSQLRAETVLGSYGLKRYLLQGQASTNRLKANVQFGLHQSDGYRERTALVRGVLNADAKLLTANGALSATFLYSDLAYGTPGGLTQEEYEANPRQARPPTSFPGAVQARAEVDNRTVFGGLIYEHDWNVRWTTTTGVYAGSSAFENPTIRNYESRDETNVGVRTTTEYRLGGPEETANKLSIGGEYQHFGSPIAVFDNDGVGNPGAVQVRDEITSNGGLLFAQGDLRFASDIFLTAGFSLNFLEYDFKRIEPGPTAQQTRAFKAVLSPRVAILKKFSDNFSIFTSYSDGFSPPSLAEVRPSTNTFTKTLQAESGKNFELGARGSLLNERLRFDVVMYDFALRNTIVVRQNQDNADYFINAGKTSQRGIEAYASWNFTEEDATTRVMIWGSYAYQHYRFKASDLTGNALTGVAPNVFSGGVDLNMKRGFSSSIILNYVDRIPLNDANSVFADSYVLVGLRSSYSATFGNTSRFQLFAGIENLFDELYSLGNDLNAFGGRYYNAAMPRNFYAGVSIALDFPK